MGCKCGSAFACDIPGCILECLFFVIMKKTLLLLSLTAAMAANAQQVVTMDLAKATTKLEFDAENGAWTGTYDDDATSIETQCFSLVHNSMSDYNTWWGFTASNSCDNSRQENTIKYQFSNMAPGGIAVNEDGSVQKDADGNVVLDKTMPYAVAFVASYMAKHPVQVAFNTGKLYEPVGAYFNLTSYTYYCVEFGDSYASAFFNGDKLTVTAHGVAADESEKTLDFDLASFTNGNLTINRGWTYVDLSALGVVNEIYFTMTSTDKGAYGENTPLYFAMDKLMVKEAASDALAQVNAANTITYDRASSTVTVPEGQFAMVCDVAGAMLMSGDAGRFDLSDLQAGIYIVRCGNSTLKLAR